MLVKRSVLLCFVLVVFWGFLVFGLVFALRAWSGPGRDGVGSVSFVFGGPWVALLGCTVPASCFQFGLLFLLYVLWVFSRVRSESFPGLLPLRLLL